MAEHYKNDGKFHLVSDYTSTGDRPAAIDAAYGLVDNIHFDNAYYRHDIGKKALQAQEV